MMTRRNLLRLEIAQNKRGFGVPHAKGADAFADGIAEAVARPVWQSPSQVAPGMTSSAESR